MPRRRTENADCPIQKHLLLPSKVCSGRCAPDRVKRQLKHYRGKLLAVDLTVADPLMHFRRQVRAAYEHVIGLIYDCASNRAAANALVTKILAKLQIGSLKATKTVVRGQSRKLKRSQC
jgi:hypothetical protein